APCSASRARWWCRELRAWSASSFNCAHEARIGEYIVSEAAPPTRTPQLLHRGQCAMDIEPLEYRRQRKMRRLRPIAGGARQYDRRQVAIDRRAHRDRRA